MLIDFAMVAIGLMLLAYGGDYLVRAALSLARLLNVSPMFSGVVIVGFGTSAPELLVSLDAAFRGQPDIAVGNVVGSNIANTLLILGVAALIAPIACSAKEVRRDLIMALMASLILWGLGLYGFIPRWAGVGMVTIMVLYIIITLTRDKGAHDETAHDETSHDETSHDETAFDAPPHLARDTAIVLISAGMLAFGADLLVDGATTIARAMGVSDAVIGLSLVAIGTSLPELAAAVVAAARRQTDVIIGNVFGSTLFNILIILGLTAFVEPLTIAAQITAVDIPISIAVLVLAGILATNSTHIRAGHGLFFCGLYAVYSVWLLA